MTIEGGYFLSSRQLNKKVRHAAPTARELWTYLFDESNFIESKWLKPGQLVRSYSDIQKDLSWKHGNTHRQYSTNQIYHAISCLKKFGLIKTKRVTRGILITICNYSYIQDKRNYESDRQNINIPHDISILVAEQKTESDEIASESDEKQGTESDTESENKNQANGNNTNTFHDSEQSESDTGSDTGSDENQCTIHNIHQYNQDNYISSTTVEMTVPECEDGELDFERDRRIYCQALPGVKTYQNFDDDQNRKNPKLIRQVHVKDHMPVEITLGLEKLNSYGAGVYMTVNETDGTGRKAENITKVRAVFADFDGQPIDDVWQYEPSMVIESSPGKFHAYWLTDDVPLEAFTAIQECIAVRFGSDPKVKDLPRVMRVPGFEHRKGEPFMTRIIHYTGAYFTFGRLVEMFPPDPRPQWSAEKYKPKNPVNGNSEYRGDYGAPQGGRNNHITTRIGGMLKRGLSWPEIESEAYKEAAACSPPLPERETALILRSMRRYA